MLQNKKVLIGILWRMSILFQILLSFPLSGAEKDASPTMESWMEQLNQKPMEVPSHIGTLDELQVLAAQRNADLRAQYADWQGNLEKTRSIPGLPDPTLGLGYYLEPIETAQGPQSAKLSLGQTIPWFSKIRSDRKGSHFHAIQSFEMLQTLRLSLERNIDKLWAEAWQIQSLTSIIEAKLTLSKDLEKVLQIQYQSAAISHKKLFEVQIQSLQLENKLQDLQSRYQRLMVHLGDFLEDNAALPEDFLPAISLTIQDLETDSGVSPNHPRLTRFEASKNEAGADIESAQAAFIPDIKIGLDYIFTDQRVVNGVIVEDSGKDPLIVSAGLALPLWNWKSKRSAVRSSEWKFKKAQALHDAEMNRLSQEYEIAQSMLAEQLRNIYLYEDQLIPKAQEIESVMQQEYISQSSDVFSYTMAKQQVLDLKLALVNAKYFAQLQMAELRYLKGN